MVELFDASSVVLRVAGAVADAEVDGVADVEAHEVSVPVARAEEDGDAELLGVGVDVKVSSGERDPEPEASDDRL